MEQRTGTPSVQEERGRADQTKSSHPYPKTVFLILGSKFFERLSFLAMNSILSLYINHVLMFDQNRSTTIYHSFTTLCYICPLFGAVMADQFLGKFRTIVYMSLIFLLGHVLKTLAAIPTLGVPQVWFSLMGLLLIAIGSGCMKPCGIAFGGDQFELPDQERQLQRYFSVLHFIINAAALIGMFMSPVLREDVYCFGDESCFSLAFGVSGLLTAFSLVMLVVGKGNYKMVPPQGSSFVKLLRNISHTLKKIIEGKRTEHWMDLSCEKYCKEEIKEVKKFLKVLVMFIPFPIYWALLHQTGSRWTFQATGMNGKIGNTRIKPDQINFLVPALSLLFIPLFDKIVYPLFAKINFLTTPLQKIGVSGVIISCSFFLCGWLELGLQTTYARVPGEGWSSLHLLNTVPCNMTLLLHTPGSQALVHEGTISALNNQVIHNIEAGAYDIRVKSQCQDKLQSAAAAMRIETHSTKVSGVLLSEDTGSVSLVPLQQFDDPVKDLNGKAKLKVVFQTEKLPLKSGNLILKSTVKNFTINLDREGISSTNYIKLEPGIYEVVSGDHLLGSVSVEQGGVYSLVVAGAGLLQLTLTSPNTVHMVWMVPQILLITLGDIMFAIPSSEFAYSQAPASMKSVVLALWMLTIALGNVIVILVAEVATFEDRAVEFFMFASLMLLNVALFIILTFRHKFRLEERDNNNALQLCTRCSAGTSAISSPAAC